MAESVEAQVEAAVRWLRGKGSKRNREGMARYAIPSENAFGVWMAVVQAYAKRIGRNQELAEALWETGWHEVRNLAVFVAEPAKVTPALMDRWCRDFNSWAICDTVCFHLFDRTPHALKKVVQWSRRKKEFEKRAAFALLASVALHDKKIEDGALLQLLPLVEGAAGDDRNFVKKGVSWALRLMGRRSVALHRSSLEVAQRLRGSENAAARWVGRDAYRELTSAAVVARVKKRG